MSAPHFAVNAQPRLNGGTAHDTAFDFGLALPASQSDDTAGLVFDLLLTAAARDARCRPVAAARLDTGERDARRAALLQLWKSCSSRIIDESLLADILARRGVNFITLATPRHGVRS